MSSSRNHQGAHGIGQVEQQLNHQAQAAETMQGPSELDRNVVEAASREDSELDEIIES